MRTIVLFFSCVCWAHAQVLPICITPPLKNNVFMGIKILDQKQLTFRYIDDVKFTELSDVTYDNNTEILYFVGDRGSLFAFNAKFEDSIALLSPLYATKLKTQQGKNLRHWKRDSEGLTLDGKNRLLISFEGEAQVSWFHKNSAKRGRRIHTYTLPKQLRASSNYRSKNKSLESLTWHKKFGLLTATEWPLKRDDKKKQTIYALSGKKWHFTAEPESKSAVVGMEVMDDGNILVLERSYTGLFRPLVITLKKVMIKNCHTKRCPRKVLAKFSTHKGWDIDNFEGLAKVSQNRYVIVSDDNDNFFQKTLLIYFEVL